MSIGVWLLILIIIFLAVFILIRDRAVRQVFKRFFKWIRKRIRVARIKSQISREKEKMEDLIRNLGEEVYKKEIYISHIEGKKEEITNLKNEKNEKNKKIENVVSEVEKEKRVYDEFKKKQEILIKTQENEKNAQEVELRKIKKDLDEIKKKVDEKEKMKLKTEKSLAGFKVEIGRIESDVELSKIEKKERKDEIERKIEELNKKIVEINRELVAVREGTPNLNEKIKKIIPIIAEYNKKINDLKEREKSEGKKCDGVIENLVKEKNRMHTRMKEIENRNRLLFTEIGEEARKNRIERSELSELYSQIDKVEKNIKELEDQIK